MTVLLRVAIPQTIAVSHDKELLPECKCTAFFIKKVKMLKKKKKIKN